MDAPTHQLTREASIWRGFIHHAERLNRLSTWAARRAPLAEAPSSHGRVSAVRRVSANNNNKKHHGASPNYVSL